MRRDRPARPLLDAWGLTDSVNGLEKFALAATEALAPEVAAVKPQSAFFERFGSRGVEVLERVIATAREAGALVVLDVKRGDIGSTAQAYADAYLDPVHPSRPMRSRPPRTSASAVSSRWSPPPARTTPASSCSR